jgi:hypothetical protein
MKYLIAVMIATVGLSSAAPVLAHGTGHHGHHGHHSGHWVLPALIGGAVVYAATRPQTVVVASPPAVAVPQDSMILDGVIYRRQIMIIDGVTREVWVRN